MTGNVADLLRRAATAFPAASALITDDAQISWAELDAAADAGAGALSDAGARPGDLILLHLPTGPELAVALFAAARAGLVAVPVDPHRDAAEIAERLAVRVLITEDWAQPAPVGVAVVDRSTVGAWFGVTAPKLDSVNGGEDIAIIARASRGARAVLLSHRAIMAAVDAIVAAPHLELRRQDRVLLVLPLFHLAGFVTAFLPLTAVGAAAVVADTPPVTGPQVVGTGAWTAFSTAVLNAVHRHRVTVIPGAPPLYRLLLRSSELERSLATVRLMTSAASPLSPDDGAAIRARTGSPVWEGYGISESASAVASTLMTDVPRHGSVGLPLTGVEVRIEPADGTVATTAAGAELDGIVDDDVLASIDADADPGRISIRGPQLFSGYWPDGSDGPDADGWFTTSDLGYVDARGELRLVDRIAETVSIAGFRVYPREVEAAFLTHPQVRDAAVVGVPSAAGVSKSTVQLVGVVVLAKGATLRPEDLIEHLAGLLPAFKRPTQVLTVPILPRTELGRLDRDAVRAEAAGVLGVPLAETLPTGTRLSVVPVAERTPMAVPKTVQPKDLVPKDVPPKDVVPLPAEVIEVSQLDQLGSRLPGVAQRSRRSAQDTDSDLFGEDEFDPPVQPPTPAQTVGGSPSDPPGQPPTPGSPAAGSTAAGSTAAGSTAAGSTADGPTPNEPAQDSGSAEPEPTSAATPATEVAPTDDPQRQVPSVTSG